MEHSFMKEALRKSLEEKEKIEATVDGLIGKLANMKVSQIEDILKQEEFNRQGLSMKLADIHFEKSCWEDTAFYLKVSLMLKDTNMKVPLTKKEANVMNKYRALVKDARWDSWRSLKGLLPYAGVLNAEIHRLKNDIALVEKFTFAYTFEDIMKPNFFTRGIKIELR